MLAEHDKHCSSAILGTVSTIFASLVLTWFWSRADVCKLTPLIRKSASVGFTWFTLNISSGLLLSSDSLKPPGHSSLWTNAGSRLCRVYHFTWNNRFTEKLSQTAPWCSPSGALKEDCKPASITDRLLLLDQANAETKPGSWRPTSYGQRAEGRCRRSSHWLWRLRW